MTAPMVAQADATLYGSFRVGLAFQEGADANLRDESTRIGIKGTVDLGLEDTKGLFHWEANLNTTDDGQYGQTFGQRLAYAGATGSWGTVLVGKQYHPHYTMVVSHTNVFNSADGEFGEAFVLGNANHKRVDNTIAYASPVMGGFQVVAGAVMDAQRDAASYNRLPGQVDVKDNGNFDKTVDGYNIAAQFTGVEGLRASVSYGDVSTNVGGLDYDSEIWGVGATYKIADFTVAARYEDREDTLANVTLVDADSWELAGIYQMGATALKARYGNLDLGAVDGDQWGVEVEHKLGQKGMMWVGYTDIDKDVAVGRAADTLVVGYRLDF
jgi:predicted porin